MLQSIAEENLEILAEDDAFFCDAELKLIEEILAEIGKLDDSLIKLLNEQISAKDKLSRLRKSINNIRIEDIKDLRNMLDNEEKNRSKIKKQIDNFKATKNEFLDEYYVENLEKSFKDYEEELEKAKKLLIQVIFQKKTK